MQRLEKHKDKIKKGLPAVLLLSAYIFFTVFALWGLSDSNITLDEAEHGFWARDVMVKVSDFCRGTKEFRQLPHRYYTGPFFFVSPPLRPDILLPIMTCSFTGAFIIYFIVPFVFLFGETVFALKIGFILLGAATAGCVYYTIRHFLGKITATLTAFILLTNSFFIKQARAGAETESTLQIFFLWAGAALICRAVEKKKAFCFYLACMLWGLALWAKIMFVPYIAGIGLSLLMLKRDVRRDVSKQFFGLKISFVWAFLFLFIGIFPLLYYNTQTLGATFRQTFSTLLTGKNHNNVSDGELTYRLSIRSKQIQDTILHRNSFPLDRAGGKTNNPVNTMFTLIAVAAVIKFALSSKNTNNQQAAFLKTCLITYTTVYFFSGFSPGSYAAEHMGALLPAAEIAQAWLLTVLIKARYKCAGITLASAVLIANTSFEIPNMTVFLQNHKTMTSNMLWLRHKIKKDYTDQSPNIPLVVHNSAASYYYGCTPDKGSLELFKGLTANKLRMPGTWNSDFFTSYTIRDHIFLLTRNREPEIAANLKKFRVATFPYCGFFLHKIPKSARTQEELNHIMFKLTQVS